MALTAVLAACVHPPRSVAITIGPAHELIVPVVVDGQELRFQLDTGATTTAIVPSVVARLKPQQLDLVRGTGAGGPIGQVQRVVFRTTELADTEIYRVLAAVIELGGASDGVLGMDALAQVTAEIDLVHDRLSIYDRDDGAWATPDLIAVPYTSLASGQIAIDVELDGHHALGIVDLGANQSFANRLVEPARDEAARVVTAPIGADGHAVELHAFDQVALAIGGIAFTAPKLLVADLPIFAELGVAGRPAVILGVDALAGRRVVIDPRAHRVYLSRVRSKVVMVGFTPAAALR